ncbi:hypothetical protein LWI29_008450 [Acer saccharum]|uniref:Uncharacterized protein n=1 Tax=Acer saccharum TaxID=4024 RepID=A0AA39RGQ2_ACESA|nr:hypothetical protein LWI29_008450 [Acer saccharum]KAK1553470.1 hypothetical protein Q3G72_035691 [Acer saccharum]
MARDYYSSSNAPLPIHLYCFLVILLMFIGFSWYIKYEQVLESLFDQVKLYLIVSPLLLLLLVHWLSNDGSGRFSYLIPLPADQKDRAGGTPWGVGFVLVILLFLISYQSYFQERWFPLLTR